MPGQELYLASVSSLSPLKVRLDGTTTEVVVSYQSNDMPALAVSDRVVVAVVDRLVVLVSVVSLGGASSGAANRNLLDNGQFEINQRATLAVQASSANFNVFGADRWHCSNAGVGSLSVAIQTYATFGVPLPAGRPRPAFIQYWFVNTPEAPGSLAATDAVILYQQIEGQFLRSLQFGFSDAKPVTVSLDVYCSVVGTFILELSSLSSDGRKDISRSFQTTAAGWQTVNVTFPGDTLALLDFDNAGRLQASIWLGAGTDYTTGTSLQTTWGTTQNKRCFGHTNSFAATASNVFAATNFQAEPGSSASPYEVKRFSNELLACMRYWEKSYNYAVAPATNTAVGLAVCKVFDSTVLTRMAIYGGQFAVRKRATPALTVWSSDGTPGTINLYNNAVSRLNLSSFNSPSDRGVGDYLNTTANGVADTMYNFHWSANAEI